MRGKAFAAIFVIVFIMSFAATVGAQTARDETQGDFRWTIAPYAWLTGISGTVGAKGYDANVDVFYSLLSDQTSSKRASLDAKMSLAHSDVVAFYRVGTVPLGNSQTSSMDYDLLGGARIWSLAVKLDAERDRGGRNVFAQKTWADPIVGARAMFHLIDA